jgi:hypothetical protein
MRQLSLAGRSGAHRSLVEAIAGWCLATVQCWSSRLPRRDKGSDETDGEPRMGLGRPSDSESARRLLLRDERLFEEALLLLLHDARWEQGCFASLEGFWLAPWGAGKGWLRSGLGAVRAETRFNHAMPQRAACRMLIDGRREQPKGRSRLPPPTSIACPQFGLGC